MKYSAYEDPNNCRKLIVETPHVDSKYALRFVSFVMIDEVDEETNHVGRVTLTRAQAVDVVGELTSWLGRP